jgi:hypothetical protein
MDGLVDHRHPSLDQSLELLAGVRAEGSGARSRLRCASSTAAAM